MSVLPKSLLAVIEALGFLPGVGPRSAERYAYFLLKNEPNRSKKLAEAINSLHSGVKHCPKTFALIDVDQDFSPLYSDPARDKKIVTVVADPFDIVAIENTGNFRGTYHVLGGLISPIDGLTPEKLHIDDLINRVKKDNVEEVILATNASVEGESTALYIGDKLKNLNVKVSRLARGLPIGLDLEYADQITLKRALDGRTNING